MTNPETANARQRKNSFGVFRRFRPEIVLLRRVTAAGAAILVLCWVALYAHAIADIDAFEKDAADDLSQSNIQANQSIETWFDAEQLIIERLASSPLIIADIVDLSAPDTDIGTINEHPAQARLRASLGSAIGIGDFDGYFIIDRNGMSLASYNPANTGTKNFLAEVPEFLDRAWAGQTVMSPLMKTDVPIKLANDETCSHRWNFFFATPVRDANGTIDAVMTTRHNPGVALLPLLATHDAAAGVETYLVDSQGRMISPSRFSESFLSNVSCEPTLPFVDRTDDQQISEGDKAADDILENLMLFDSHSAEVYRNHMGTEVLGIWSYSDKTRLGVISEKNFSAIRSQQTRIAYQSIAAGAGVAVFLCLLLLLLYRSIQAIAARNEAGWLFDAMQRGVFFLDKEGRFVRVNDTFCRQVGRKTDDLIGKPLWSLDNRLRDPFEKARDAISNEPGQREATTNISLRDAENRKRYYFIAIASVRQVTKGLFGGVCADVTEIDRDQRALAAANAQAEATARARDAFLELASHEMRTPLNAVVSGLSLLKIDQTDPESVRFFNMIQSGAKDLLNAVQGMENYVSSVSGTKQLDIAPFNLREALKEAVSAATEKYGHQINVETTLTAETADYVVSDRTIVIAILAELLSNAATHGKNGSPGGEEIGLHVQKVSQSGRDDIEICVSDAGDGLDAGEVEKAFQVLSRLNTKNTSVTRGLGIGLPIAVERARSLGGTLTYRPNPRGGSIFALRLPVNIAANQRSK